MLLLYPFFLFFLLQMSHIMHILFFDFFCFRESRILFLKKKYYIFVTIFFPDFIAFEACFLYNSFMYMRHNKGLIISYYFINNWYKNFVRAKLARMEVKLSIDFKIDTFIYNFSSSCKRVQKKSFSKNQVITTYIQKRNQLCILLNR